MKRKGFTLIELTVVMGVMALLIALAVPLYANYLDEVELINIKNNIKLLENEGLAVKVREEGFPTGEKIIEVPSTAIDRSGNSSVDPNGFYTINYSKISKVPENKEKYLMSSTDGKVLYVIGDDENVEVSNPEAPPAEYTVSLNLIADTYANQKSPTTNYGGDSKLNLLTDCPTSGGGYSREIYLKFSLDTLKSRGVKAEDIRSAEFKVYYYYGDISYRVQQGEVYSNESSWEEDTLTWDTRPGKGEFLGVNKSQPQKNPGYGWRTTDITDITKQWLSGKENNGVRIENTGKPQDESSDPRGEWNNQQFYSKESGTNIPEMTVVYFK